jgi:hypothetical protein
MEYMHILPIKKNDAIHHIHEEKNISGTLVNIFLLNLVSFVYNILSRLYQVISYMR